MGLDALLAEMVALDASDLYVATAHVPVVNARGRFVPVGDGLVPDAAAVEALVRAALPAPDLARWVAEGDANAAYAADGVPDRFRVNAFRQRGVPGLVIRRIRTKFPTLEEIGAPKVLATLALAPRGLVLVTGATGTGKSTTLAAMIDHRNANRPGHIVTLEDPIEFVHSDKQGLVTQREVGFDTPSFAAGLKNALRQAPSVLLVGEIRDAETAEAALHFAETGHLVLSTLHSTNANQTLKRLINLFPAETERGVLHQTSLNLVAVVSQRLVPRADGTGRVAAFEVLLNTPRASDLIREGRIEELKEAMLQAQGDGAQTFDAHLYELQRAGAITADAAIAAADSPNDVRLRIRLESGPAKPSSSIRLTPT
jgi:twitching motility protein PilU